ncbi:MAG: tripartite tricarboxylate transporter TctB family protein [Reyranellaceae bacterium]
MSENSQASNVTPPPSARTDLITAAILLAFGLTIIALALRMPTFTAATGSAFTAPGIVPGFHGTVIAVLSIALALRSVYRGAFKPGGGKPAGFEGLPGISLKRLFIAAGLGIVYAVVLVGWLPFWLASAVFIAAFTIIFEWDATAPMALRVRRAVTASILGIVIGAAVFLLFQELFLVRLP